MPQTASARVARQSAAIRRQQTRANIVDATARLHDFEGRASDSFSGNNSTLVGSQFDLLVFLHHLRYVHLT